MGLAGRSLHSLLALASWGNAQGLIFALTENCVLSKGVLYVKKAVPVIKSVLILGLAALAIYQVSRLWLFDITNEHFGLYLQARFPPAAPDGQSAFARPFRILGGAGDGRFSVRYSGIEDSDEWAFGETALGAILQNGTFSGVHSGNAFAEILQNPVFIYEYAFDMDTTIFARIFGRRGGGILTDAGIIAFRSIAIIPPSLNNSMLRVFFMDNASNGSENPSEARIWEFTLQPGTRRHPVENFDVAIVAIGSASPHLVATESGFIPYVPTSGFSYNAVFAQNPFRDPHGMFTLTFIKSRVEQFFENPATITPSMSPDSVLTFSNRNTLVRYLESAVIEYVSYRTIGRATDNFMADFSAALAFTQNDIGAATEIFLRNHEPRGRENVFWFDYVIDNRPLVMMQPWYTSPNCTDPLFSPIEVVVENGRVVRYRRLAYTFQIGNLAWLSTNVVDAATAAGEDFFLGFPIGESVIELSVIW